MRRYLWSLWRFVREPRLRTRASLLGRRMERINALPQAEFRAFQLEALRRHLAWCRRWVPWYRDLFASIRLDLDGDFSWEEFQKIPPLTRDVLREHASELKASWPGLRGVFVNHTGGSTGQPVSFLQDENYVVHSLAADRCFRRTWQLPAWAKTAFVWGHSRDTARRSWRDRAWDWWAGQVFLDAFQLDEKRARQFVQFLDRWQPRAIYGYASALGYLARHVPAGAPLLRRLQLVRSSAETLTPPLRGLLERVFGVPVVDFYGSREINHIAWQCPAAGRLHVFSPWRIVELAGPPLDAEGTRQVLVTDLANRAMPLVRYALGDLAAPVEGPCRCGSGAPALAKLRGRVTDLIRAADGSWIHGEYFTHLFYGQRGVARFQLRQHADGSLLLLLEGNPEEAAPGLEKILATIRSATGCDLSHRWLTEIPTPPSGKFRFTTSALTPPLDTDPGGTAP